MIKIDEENLNVTYFVEFNNGSIKYFEYPSKNRRAISIIAMMRDMDAMTTALAIVNGITIPILCYILYRLIHFYRKSFYTPFLTVITVLALAESAATWIYCLTNILMIFEFKYMCHLVSFIRFLEKDATHWIWAAMYFQRYLFIFYPLKRIKQNGIWRYMNNTKCLIIFPILAALFATTVTLLQRNQYHLHSNNKTYTVCNISKIWISNTVTDIIRGIKLMYAFFIPFIIILYLDFKVVFRKNNSVQFGSIMNINSMQDMNDSCSYKIVSPESLKQSQDRRQQSIKNCFIITTMQALLNFPIYFHTLLYQCFHLYHLSPRLARRVEITVFVLYFLQLPLKALFKEGVAFQTNFFGANFCQKVAIHLLCRSYCVKVGNTVLSSQKSSAININGNIISKTIEI